MSKVGWQQKIKPNMFRIFSASPNICYHFVCIYIYIYKSRHEPIGVRGFLSCFVCFLCNKVFGIFGAVVREPKRRDRCTMLLISRYFPLFSLMLHMLDPYFPLFSVGLRYFGELFIEVSRIW